MKESIRKIPRQRTGAKSDTSFSVQVRNEQEAMDLFQMAKQNLLSVNDWKSFAGKPSADFKLTDKTGKPVNRTAHKDALIRIHLPMAEKDVFDWVKIESIESSENNLQKQWIMITVRPVAEPGTNNSPDHFFSDTATSSFIIERENKKVTAAIRGRNELPNTKHKGFLKKIRNSVIAFFSMSGLNKPQWKALCKGLLQNHNHR